MSPARSAVVMIMAAAPSFSAMVPLAGAETRIFREVCALGADLGALADVAGSTVDPPPVAILFDYQSLWAARLPAHPRVEQDMGRQVHPPGQGDRLVGLLVDAEHLHLALGRGPAAAGGHRERWELMRLDALGQIGGVGLVGTVRGLAGHQRVGSAGCARS